MTPHPEYRQPWTDYSQTDLDRGVISSQENLCEKRDAMVCFGRATVQAMQFFKTHKSESIVVIGKYVKVDASALESACTYIKLALSDHPNS